MRNARWIFVAVSVGSLGALACSSSSSSGPDDTSLDDGGVERTTDGSVRGPDGSTLGRDGGTSPGLDGAVPPGVDGATPPRVDGAAPPPVDAGAVVGYVPGGKPGVGTTVSGCAIFPNDNAWNVEVDGTNVPLTSKYSLPQGTHLHPDLGGWSSSGGGPYGIPYNVVASGAANLPTTFGCFADQSDPGPSGWTSAPAQGNLCPAYGGGEVGVTAYPFFTGMKVEGNYAANAGVIGALPGDAHALILQQGAAGASCTLWEAWNCEDAPSPFVCANGAKWNLGSNALRTAGWTSADLAGLSVFAGLLKIAEVKAGTITHAVRVTFNDTQAGYLLPATHAISSGSGSSALGGSNPPMGLHLRMKANVDTSGFSAPGKAVAAAMKKYGLIVADIGSDWYFQGDSDDGWNDTDTSDTYVGELITDFGKVSGADFEVIDTGTPSNKGL